MPSNKVQPLVPGHDIIRAADTINVKPVDCAVRKYYEHQQTAYRLSAKQGAALLHNEQQARQKLAQEAPVVLAQLEASAKTKIAAQLAASVGLATLQAPRQASGSTSTPYRQQSLPVLHSVTWFRRLGLAKHSRSAVWPASSSTVQQAAGSSPSQTAAMNYSADYVSSEAQRVRVPSLASLGPQVCISHPSQRQELPNVAAVPLTRAAWQQDEGSTGQPTWQPSQQKLVQYPPIQLPLLQSRNTAQECECCAAERQLVHLHGVCSSSSSSTAQPLHARGCCGLATSTQPSFQVPWKDHSTSAVCSHPHLRA